MKTLTRLQLGNARKLCFYEAVMGKKDLGSCSAKGFAGKGRAARCENFYRKRIEGYG